MCWGGLYVVEGSLLGGRILNRKLDSLFGEDNNEGRIFFSWCAAQDARRWTRFCEVLERRGATAGVVEGIVDAANQIFASMLAWLKADEAMAFPTPDRPLSSRAANA